MSSFQSEISDQPTLHRAGWVVVDSQSILQNGFILTANGRIEDVGNGKFPQVARIVNHGPGVLLPPLVNAHTHLELCALKGQVSMDHGFTHWVQKLIILRESLSQETLIRGIEQGIQQLIDSGTLIVGDISSFGLSWDALKRSPLAGVLFKEYLGTSPPTNLDLDDDGQFIQCFAGHAPHTTAPALLNALSMKNNHGQRPFSLHLAESDDETEFITTGSGKWAEFLVQREIEFQDWPLPAKSPVEYLHRLNLLKPGLLTVHLLQCTRRDFDLLAKNNVAVCICPQSNQNLHRKKPDLNGMIRAGLMICLGTDSLASCDSLSIFSEMAALSKAYQDISPESFLHMATHQGASALGLGNQYGTLSKGKQALMLYLPTAENRKEVLLERLVNSADAAPIVIDER